MRLDRKQTAAFSMLELIVATAMLTTIMSSVVVLIRTSYSAWESHERDLEKTENVYATLRHIIRRVRQAELVTDISAPAETAGRLTLLMSDGNRNSWARQPDDRVLFGVGAPSDLLASDITALSFAGYQADGVTATVDPEDIQLIEIRATTQLQHGAGEQRALTCRAWLRTW